LGFLGLWENTHSSRFLTGALLGAVAVFYVVPGLIELSLTNWTRAAGESINNADKRATALSNAASVPQSDYSAPHRRI